MLLIIEALLLISAVQDHRTAVEGQIIPLDMAENSVDDRFDRCSKEMERRVQTEFMKIEMNNSDFARVWKNAEMNHTTSGDNLSKNHSVAIYAYTNSKILNFTLYDIFNKASRTDKQKYKDGKYSWYSLHFWLTEAIQILKKTQNKCYETFRGTNVTFDKNVKSGTVVRFGQFASTSLNLSEAEKFGNKSCFEIYTCEGADVAKYARFPDQKEVLIPPYETFTVTDVKTRAQDENLWCDTVFILKNYSTRSDLNCAVSSGNQVAFLNVLLILIVFCSLVSF